MKQIVNVETGESIEKPFDDDEIVQIKKDLAEQKKIAEELDKKLKAKNLLLEKLGITEEEAKLLLS